MNNFIHVSTDGPFNPYSKVYSLKEVREDFPDFFVAIGAFEVFLLAEVEQAVIWLRATEAFFQPAGSAVATE